MRTPNLLPRMSKMEKMDRDVESGSGPLFELV